MTQSIGGIPSIQSFGTPQRSAEVPSESIATDDGGASSSSFAGDSVSAQGMGTGSASALSLDDFGSDSLDNRYDRSATEDLDDFVGPFPDLGQAPGSSPTLSQEELQERVVSKLLAPLPSVSPLPEVNSFREMDRLQRSQLIENIRNDQPLQEAFQNWDRLGFAAKMQAGTRISDMQAQTYGFTAAPLRFDTDLMKDPASFGYFSHEYGDINLSPYHLDNLPEFVNTVVHEQTHAYQAAVAHGVEQRVAAGQMDESNFMVPMGRAWADNFKNYVNGYDDPAGYRTQPVELHAWATGDGVMNGVFAK